MVIWSGLGFLIAIIGLGALIGTEVISENLTGNESFYQNNSWVIFLGMLVAAGITYLLNKTILAPKSRAVIDKETGQEIILKKEHSLFFIPSKWWPAIYVIIGIVFVIKDFFPG